MSEDGTEHLRFPIGRFKPRNLSTSDDFIADAGRIRALPLLLRKTVEDYDDRKLDTYYRPGGWTVRQVIHHLADSHLHAWIRIKWALTEDQPVIKAYLEKSWAETPDHRFPVETSLRLLEAHHGRWADLLVALSAEQADRTFHHPVSGADITIRRMAELYAWHGEHHLAHCKLV